MGKKKQKKTPKTLTSDYTYHPPGHATHKDSLLLQRLPTQWDQISTNPPDTQSFPSSSIQPANAQTTMTTVNLGTAMKKSDVPAMWSFLFFLFFWIALGFCWCQEGATVHMLCWETCNNRCNVMQKICVVNTRWKSMSYYFNQQQW